MEMTALITLSGVLMAGVLEVQGQMRRWSEVDTAIGIRAEIACRQLRQDMAWGRAESTADGLWISGTEGVVAWTFRNGEVQRNGRPMAAVKTWQISLQDRQWRISFTPPGLPARTIEAAAGAGQVAP